MGSNPATGCFTGHRMTSERRENHSVVPCNSNKKSHTKKAQPLQLTDDREKDNTARGSIQWIYGYTDIYPLNHFGCLQPGPQCLGNHRVSGHVRTYVPPHGSNVRAPQSAG